MRLETTVKFRVKIQAFANRWHHQGVLLLYDSHYMFAFLLGEAERVEMVIDDVVVEVSKHRGIGRMYLTNFR